MARVVLIDNNALNRDILSRRLSRRGYEVLATDNAREGLTLASTRYPDAVLMSLHLHDGPGWTAARMLKADATTAIIPIIALTSPGQPAEAERARAVGCDLTLPRPIDFPALLDVLGELLARKGRAQLPRYLAQEPPPANPPMVLVVDDEEMNRDMLSRRLEKRGYTVVSSPSGPDALERLSHTRFDLVLLDVMMPEMNGLVVLKRIREVLSTTDLPVIMATARNQSEDLVAALEAGANDYVTKPLDFPVVLARLQTQLQLRQATESLRASEARFRMLAEYSTDVVARQSPDGRWLYASPASRTLLGYDPAELVGESSHDLVHPDDFDHLAERLVVDDDPSAERQTLTCRLRRKSGEYAWFETAFQMLRDADSGEVVEVQAAYRNVTDQVRERNAAFEDLLHHFSRIAQFRAGAATGHAHRFGRTCELLALRMGQGPVRADLIRRASTLHDVGNVCVPRELLERAGSLADDEIEVVRAHTTDGWELLHGTGNEVLELAAVIALSHHEHFDGTGYPKGRRGRAIPLEGRIAALADTFDAITSTRPWRPAGTAQQALDAIVAGRGTHFDPELVDQFFAISDDVAALRAVWPDP